MQCAGGVAEDRRDNGGRAQVLGLVEHVLSDLESGRGHLRQAAV